MNKKKQKIISNKTYFFCDKQEKMIKAAKKKITKQLKSSGTFGKINVSVWVCEIFWHDGPLDHSPSSHRTRMTNICDRYLQFVIM